jgi:hypothetical protein
MVIYDLICDANHQFEGWFKNAEDMQKQRESGFLTCPFCDSMQITKKLTASKLTRKSNSLNTSSESSAARQEVAVGGGQNTEPGSATSPEKFVKLQKMLGEVHSFIDQNFEDVGNRFSEEAINIHNGDREPSNIRGTASSEQIKEMAEQGVDAIPLPPKPIDRKKVN